MIPIPASAMASGASVPRPLVATMTWTFSILLGLELALAATRFYILDIWGGVIMTLISVFGIFLVRYEFDLQWVVMFGITIFFYGLIHFVMLLERMILNWGSFPSAYDAANPRMMVKDIVFIASPIVDWTLTALCAYVFRKSVYTSYSMSNERQPILGSRTNSTLSGGSSFTPFSGQGHKLA
jgi:hypothetical protein